MCNFSVLDFLSTVMLLGLVFIECDVGTNALILACDNSHITELVSAYLRAHAHDGHPCVFAEWVSVGFN